MCTSDAQCDDGAYCNGAETCVAGACVAGAPPCDDQRSCTVDTCDEANKSCASTPDDTQCDDGVYCNGADTCDAGECSVHEGNPCSGTCNEAGEYCECATKDDCPADEVGEYGDCAYATECVETAMKSRTVTKYSCNGVGKCVAEHVAKGAMIMVTGRIHYTKWTDQNGTDRYGCEIIAEQVDFLAKAKESAPETPKKRRAK